MTKAFASIDIPAPLEQVWGLMGGFGSLPDWLPFVPRSELTEGGRVRKLGTVDGQVIIERLEAFDEHEHSYSYTFVQTPFPVTDYHSTLRVQAADGGKSSHVEWSGEFTPKGVSDEDATRIFCSIYQDGLKALAASVKTRAQ